MDCEYKGCDKLGMYDFRGKKYCPKHYAMVILQGKEDNEEEHVVLG